MLGLKKSRNFNNQYDEENDGRAMSSRSPRYADNLMKASIISKGRAIQGMFKVLIKILPIFVAGFYTYLKRDLIPDNIWIIGHLDDLVVWFFCLKIVSGKGRRKRGLLSRLRGRF